jgi:hypothetical protein
MEVLGGMKLKMSDDDVYTFFMLVVTPLLCLGAVWLIVQ